MATAKRRAIDLLRRSETLERKHEELGSRARAPARLGANGRPRRRARRRRRRRPAAADLHRLPPGAVDRGARGAHPAPARRPDHRRDRARVPRARADGRAADRAREADARRGARRRSRCPAASELAERLASVLEVVYLIFNEGYSATAGDDWLRPALCEEALRLGRILAGARSRRARGARPGRADGDPGVALARARRARTASRCCCSTRTAARWDRLLIRRGLAALERAERARRRARPVRAAGGDRRLPRPGAHAEDTDWARIAALYDALAELSAVAGRRAEPRGRGRDGVRPGRRPRAGRRAGRRSRRSRATTCCRACAATCSRSSAAPRRRAPSSSAPPR